MTITTLLQQSSIDQLDAELLIAHVIKKPREFVMSHPQDALSLWQSYRIQTLFHKRKKGIPLAYITGHKEFYGLDFLVNKHTLIPRPDTELLVDEALRAITRPITLIDVGTGSGCIPIAIMKTTKQARVRAFGTDISKEALEVARKNAQRHDVKMAFLPGNLLEPIKHLSEVRSPKSEVCITANLPYLSQQQFDEEPSIQHEPKTALVADNNGLALYEELFKQIIDLFTVYRLPFTLFLEIDPSQSQAMTRMVQRYFPQAKVEVKKDLAGLDRVVCIQLA